MQKLNILSEDKALELISRIQSSPGIFLETTHFNKENTKSYLFSNPRDILVFEAGQNINNFFNKIESYKSEGFWIAGYFAYEFGYMFEKKLSGLLKEKKLSFPLAWLGVFKRPLVINHAMLQAERGDLYPDEDTLRLPEGYFNMSFPEYKEAIRKIKNYLVRGHTYQVNFTMKYKSKLNTTPFKLYLDLRRKQPTSFTAFVNDAERFILSFSPELFFKIHRSCIVTRPMKGTCPRGKNLSEDEHYKQFLRTDFKNRAENIMIVDLLRNDLGKISSAGSVKVSSFFDIEQYPSLFQMTSTVKSKLKKDIKIIDILKGLFPSGSVTGAPKIRTMQIIERLEKEARGVYTGSIGYFSPHNDACFNVAIRTVAIKNKSLEFGVGGGIVYDSSSEREYKECLLKTNFLVRRNSVFSLIETMLWEKGFFKFLNLHLKRLKASCRYFGIHLNFTRLKNEFFIISRCFSQDKKYKIRLLVNRQGSFDISYSDLQNLKKEVFIKLSTFSVDSNDVFLYHKTTKRELYDQQIEKAKKEGLFDVIFTNNKGQLTEGAISNIFLLSKGVLYTPPVSSGLLCGVLRQYLLTMKKAREKILYPQDLLKAEKIFVGNSVRGLLSAKIVIESRPRSFKREVFVCT